MAQHTPAEPSYRFPGVSLPTYTPVPDEYIDALLPLLSGAEFKVLLYITRHTFGYKKQSDDISLNQICRGIVRKDGTILDRGTGLSQKTVVVALKGLLEKNIITVAHHVSADRGNEPSTYALTFRETLAGSASVPFYKNYSSPPPKNSRSPSVETTEALLKKLQTQETCLQETTEQEDLSKGRSASERARDEAHAAPARRVRTPAPVPAIEAILTDYSRTLHDAVHSRSNVTQAMRLYQQSGLPEQAFLVNVHAARRIAQRRGDIRKAAADDAPLRNRMPYFFAVLEDMVMGGGRTLAAAPRAEVPDTVLAPVASDWSGEQEGPVPAPPGAAPASVWEVALGDLREQMVPTNYQRWLARTSLLSHEAGAAVVGVPDQVSADQLARRFDPLVRRALADACGETVTVRYQVMP